MTSTTAAWLRPDAWGRLLDGSLCFPPGMALLVEVYAGSSRLARAFLHSLKSGADRADITELDPAAGDLQGKLSTWLTRRNVDCLHIVGGEQHDLPVLLARRHDGAELRCLSDRPCDPTGSARAHGLEGALREWISAYLVEATVGVADASSAAVAEARSLLVDRSTSGAWLQDAVIAAAAAALHSHETYATSAAAAWVAGAGDLSERLAGLPSLLLHASKSTPRLPALVCAGMLPATLLEATCAALRDRCATVPATAITSAGRPATSARLLRFLPAFCAGVQCWLQRLSELQGVLRANPRLLQAPARAELGGLPWCQQPADAAPGRCCAPAHPYAHLHGGCGDAAAAAGGARSSCVVAGAFEQGCTGFPAVDAAVRCLRETGVLPALLLPLLVNLWCKHLGLPWPRLVSFLRAHLLVNDPALLFADVQWHAGLCAGAPWAGPASVPDCVGGGWCSEEVWAAVSSADGGPALPASYHPLLLPHPPELLPHLDLERLRAQMAWPRHHAALPPHPHCAGHPAGEEYGSHLLDAGGAFIRRWLSCGPLSLSPDLPAACLCEPHRAHPSQLAAARQVLVPTAEAARALGSADGIALEGASAPASGTAVYPLPLVDLAAGRDVCLREVMACMRASEPLAPLAKPQGRKTSWWSGGDKAAAPSEAQAVRPGVAAVSAALIAVAADGACGECDAPTHSVGSGAGASPASATETTQITSAGLRGCPLQRRAVTGFLQAQVAAAYDSRWGTLGEWPVLVEEDAEILVRSADADGSKGWAEIAHEPDRHLRVYMQQRADSSIRTVLATAELPGFAAPEVFSAISQLHKYGRWDRTWAAIRPLGGEQPALDPFNAAFMFLADAPPPPYSMLITQRDFVMTMHCWRNPHTGRGVVYLRNAALPSAPPDPTFIRGESLGCVGFVVEARASTAADHATATAAPLVVPETRSEPSAGVILLTAADPKGSIPASLINFVARRTPRMWVERLAAALLVFRQEGARGVVGTARI